MEFNIYADINKAKYILFPPVKRIGEKLWDIQYQKINPVLKKGM